LALAKRKTFKDNILNKLEDKRKKDLKPFIDEVAEAANSGKNIGEAVNKLRKKMTEVSDVRNQVIAFLFSVRVSKLFYQFRDELKRLNEEYLGIKKRDATTIPDFSKLTPDQISEVKKTIEMGKNLITRFDSYKAKLPFTMGNPKFQAEEYDVIWGRQRKGVGLVPTEIVGKIVAYLEERLNSLPGETYVQTQQSGTETESTF